MELSKPDPRPPDHRGPGLSREARLALTLVRLHPHASRAEIKALMETFRLDPDSRGGP
jgi:hypothetical protein